MSIPKRVAFSPAEFAALFGKSQTWGYRQIYQGKVKAITEHGRILIPSAEVEAILAGAGIYDGQKPKPNKTKAELQILGPKLQGAWQIFLKRRRDHLSATAPPSGTEHSPSVKSSGRKAVLDRLRRRKQA